MKFKFGDEVVVNDRIFFVCAKGVVVDYDPLYVKYTVALSHNTIKVFPEHFLIKMKGSKKK